MPRLTTIGDGVRRSSESNGTAAEKPIEQPIVTVIVPTRNEVGNVRPLVERIARAQCGMPTEVIFVDDSDDETPRVVESLGEMLSPALAVRLLHRPSGARSGGLGGAVVEGLKIARAPWVCVMDADLQHPPEVVQSLLETARANDATLVVASRYCGAGDARGLSTKSRAFVSKAASSSAKVFFPRRLAQVTDPMSGFFLVRKDAVDAAALKPSGFKILLEIAVRNPGLKVAEVAYTFGDRHSGRSKAGLREGARYLAQLGYLRGDVVRSASRSSARDFHQYDIHDIIRVESQGYLPELEAFRVQSAPRRPDVSVRIGALPAPGPSTDKHDPFHFSMRYAEMGNIGYGADIELNGRVEARATRLLDHSPHVLYTNLVEPILRWEFVRRGYALVHGACVVQGDDAFLITARTDTGKTTTMLKLLDALPYEFVSDDLTLVSSDGWVLPYPKPLTISSHTLHAVKRNLLTWRERATLPVQSRLHSRSGRRFAFLLSTFRLPAASINALAQLLIPPPKYPVQRLVPGVRVATTAKLKGVIVIHRDGDELEWIDSEAALDIVLSNTEDAYGFPPYHTIENFMLESAPENLREIERQIIAGALEDTSSVTLASTSYAWGSQIPSIIEDMTYSTASSDALRPAAQPTMTQGASASIESRDQH